MSWKRLSEWASTPHARRLRSVAVTIWMTAFWSGFVGMLFTERYPALKPFVWWTIAITFGAPFLAAAIAIVAMQIILPGAAIASVLFESLTTSGASKSTRRLAVLWCAGAGILLSLVLAGAVTLMAFGIIADVKIWFLGVCWLVLMVPWVVIGLAGRCLLHKTATDSVVKLEQGMAEPVATADGRRDPGSM